MSWIFDNLQIVIVVGSTIAWWLTQRKQGDEDTPPPTNRPGRQRIDVDQMERNRRLRDEIRRKREQRQLSGKDSSPQTRDRDQPAHRRVPELEVPEDVTEQIPPMLRELMGIPDPPRRPAPTPPPIPEVNPVSERQQRMQDEIAALEAKRREADAKAAKFKANAPQRRRRRQGASDSLSDRDFLATLRDPRQARRAIVLREVLGKPIALQ